MEQLIKQIEQWASDRNIIKGSKPIDQAMKLFSEFGELADNVGKGRDCRDDIGDVFVVLTIMSAQMGGEVMKLIIDDNYTDYIDYVDHENSKNETDLKKLVYMLNRDIHAFINSIIYTYSFKDDLKLCINCLDKIAIINKTTLKECVQLAYNDIKDRKGLMHNGMFIKESDPAYASVVKSIEENYSA
ncbi:putative nucleoside triphosphate pyrophosphohydrolase [Acinetobacter phage vB_AbM_WUPSU]|nr:putative nucleoside triphosphate pyrophosphohydrolase [Acinetobacter phage vB_AbM_WUPSU]